MLFMVLLEINVQPSYFRLRFLFLNLDQYSTYIYVFFQLYGFEVDIINSVHFANHSGLFMKENSKQYPS